MDPISRRSLLTALASVPDLLPRSKPLSVDSIARGLAAKALPQSYLGQVATRTYQPFGFYAGNTSIQSRSTHFARDAVSSLQVVLPNWYGVAGTGEVAPGADASIAASIEYPSGSFTPLTFAGAPSGTIPDGGFAVSDPAKVVIPVHAQFWVRTNYHNPNGVIYEGFNNAFAGDGSELSPAVQADKTTSGAIAASGLLYMPAAILAETTKPSVLCLGDSIMLGVRDTFDDLTGDQGIVARSIGPSFGYANFGLAGDTIGAVLASHKNRVALASYFSHVVSDYGGPNDYNSPTILTDISSLGALFPSNKRFQTTRVPNSTSSDGWATVTAQSSGTAAFFRAVNQSIRAGVQNWDGYFDVAAVLESAPDSGLWNVGPDGSHPLTADGVHPDTLGNVLVARSSAVRPEVFRR